jgi:hypothetical protein
MTTNKTKTEMIQTLHYLLTKVYRNKLEKDINELIAQFVFEGDKTRPKFCLTYEDQLWIINALRGKNQDKESKRFKNSSESK